jgi:hypothetical protein
MTFESLPWNSHQAWKSDARIRVRRREFPSDFPLGAYPHSFSILWQISPSRADGLPDAGQEERMDAFEAALVETMSGDELSILSIVVTGKNKREYVFHSRSADEFLERLSALPSPAENIPIEITHSYDPTWSHFHRLRSFFETGEKKVRS